MKPILTLLLASFLLPRAALLGEERSESRPNILFILTDDQGWSSLGCYGSTSAPTPHLDRLAADGIRFTDAYVMPQCTPTRAALFTGQHTARSGMWHVLANPWYGYPWAPVGEPAYRDALPRDWFTLPKGLRAAGYATGMAGKWHLTANADGNYVSLNPKSAEAYGFDYVAPTGIGSQNEGDKWVDHLTDSAIEFIRQERDKPWFFYLAHHTLHGKVSAPDGLIRKYRQRGAPESGLNNATYLAAIEHLDSSVGRLLSALDAMQLTHNTLVVFLSDNGAVSHSYDPQPFVSGAGIDTQLQVEKEEFSNAPLRGTKGSPYEGGIRVPCIVRWPSVVATGRTEKTPIHVIDWLPTLLDVAQGKAPPDHKLDGLSLLSLIKGNSLADRSLIWHMPLYDVRWGATPCAVIRRNQWKLIEFFGDRFDKNGKYESGPHLELFDLSQDPSETTNLAAVDAVGKQALRDELHSLLRDCQATIPGRNPHYDSTRPFKEVKVKPDFLRQR